MASMYFLGLILFYSVVFFNKEVKAGCGRFIEETNTSISSPNYPSNYPHQRKCTWEIKIPPNKSIWLNFKYFELEEEPCTSDYVTLISKKGGSVQKLENYCGSQLHGRSFHFNDSNNLMIKFQSDFRVSGVGFYLEIFTLPFECGEILEGSEGIIESPRFPLQYPPGLNCIWNIKAPLSHNIKLTFTYFKIENSTECDPNYVIVQSKMANGEIRTHGKFCGGVAPPVIVSESNLLLVRFVSHTNNGYKGFKATFLSEGCGGLVEGGRGTIRTPFSPNLYPPNKMCEWIIPVPPKHMINLYFLHFETEGGANCSNDFLQIQSRSTDGKIQEYGKYCSSSKPPPIITSKDSLLLKFISDHKFNSTGFLVEYKIDEFEPTNSTAEDQQKEEIWILKNETKILSDALTSLREEIVSLKDTQETLLSNYGDLNKMSTLITSNKVFSKDGEKNSSSLIERQLLNDFGKFLFFLRRILDLDP